MPSDTFSRKDYATQDITQMKIVSFKHEQRSSTFKFNAPQPLSNSNLINSNLKATPNQSYLNTSFNVGNRSNKNGLDNGKNIMNNGFANASNRIKTVPPRRVSSCTDLRALNSSLNSTGHMKSRNHRYDSMRIQSFDSKRLRSDLTSMRRNNDNDASKLFTGTHPPTRHIGQVIDRISSKKRIIVTMPGKRFSKLESKIINCFFLGVFMQSNCQIDQYQLRQ